MICGVTVINVRFRPSVGDLTGYVRYFAGRRVLEFHDYFDEKLHLTDLLWREYTTVIIKYFV